MKIFVFCTTFICMTYGTFLRIRNCKVSGLFFLWLFRKCHVHFFWGFMGTFLFSQKCHGHFLCVTGTNIRFLSRAKQKLSRALLGAKIVTGTFSCHGHFFAFFWKSVTGKKKMSRAIFSKNVTGSFLPTSRALLTNFEKCHGHFQNMSRANFLKLFCALKFTVYSPYFE